MHIYKREPAVAEEIFVEEEEEEEEKEEELPGKGNNSITADSCIKLRRFELTHQKRDLIFVRSVIFQMCFLSHSEGQEI